MSKERDQQVENILEQTSKIEKRVETNFQSGYVTFCEAREDNLRDLLKEELATAYERGVEDERENILKIISKMPDKEFGHDYHAENTVSYLKELLTHKT